MPIKPQKVAINQKSSDIILNYLRQVLHAKGVTMQIKSIKKLIPPLLLAALFTAGQAFAQGTGEKKTFVWQSKGLTEAGLDAGKIDAFNKALISTEVTSCIIVKDGAIVSEYYKSGYDKESVFPMHSVSKSVTGTIVGIAIEQEYFKLDDPIINYFPELNEKSDSRVKKITIRDLLKNTSGLVSTDSALWARWRKSSDWIKFLFERPLSYTPGNVFEYSTGNTHLLSAIIQRTTKKTLDEYGREVLFAPLGLDSAYFESDPQKISDGGNGLYLTARDMARFGLFFLNRGMWEGTRIVAESWIAESTKIQTPGQARYGYQWWIRWFGKEQVRGFFAHGWGEQVIAVIPAKNLVITFSSRYPDNKKNATYWQWIGDIVDATR